MDDDERGSFLQKTPKCINYEDDELRSFRSCMNWACMDQSNPWKATLSWSVFFLLAVGVPIVSHFVLSCSSCDEDHKQPYDAIVELSLSSIVSLSYLSLTNFARKYGLRKFLFLDKLCDESEKVRQGYTAQLQISMKILCTFVLPCFAVDAAYKIWWYVTGGASIPHWGNIYASHTIACSMELCSWLYRSSIFFLACVLYRVICHLQILRLEDFAQVFQVESDVPSVLTDHLRIRRTLRITSHRFRLFILLTLLLVTASQLASLLVTTKSDSDVNIYTAGELALCSVTLTRSIVSKMRNPITRDALPREIPGDAHNESDEEEGDGDNELDNTKMMPSLLNAISFQKRQALVTYLENNRAGITVYGFMLDRTYLHTIFGVELSLVLWLLSKTVGFS
ncbi:hypothetical protein Nepgr_017609 [Nepenthes gracilis]|uniref:Uncharacterized protein n=1 Tax=Nepenthes gracilis TaxID=150966 RepID=A0AAD3SPP0_NEPGR|nr:hypothetical protein Nepgr_017609 [Nepenthes gracilis]